MPFGIETKIAPVLHAVFFSFIVAKFVGPRMLSFNRFCSKNRVFYHKQKISIYDKSQCDNNVVSFTCSLDTAVDCVLEQLLNCNDLLCFSLH